MKSMIKEVVSSEDIKTTANLAYKIWTKHYVPIIGQDQVNYMLENLQSEKAISEQLKSGYLYYLIYQEDVPVGYLGLRPNYPNGKLMISKIYIDSTARGLGYGYKLLDFVKQLCLERKIERIWLTVNRHNIDSINWYKKKGFVVDGEKQIDIGNGFIMDDYILEVAAADLLA